MCYQDGFFYFLVHVQVVVGNILRTILHLFDTH